MFNFGSKFQSDAKQNDASLPVEVVVFDIVNKAAKTDLNLARQILLALNGQADINKILRKRISTDAKTGQGISIDPNSPAMDNVFERLKSQARIYQLAIEQDIRNNQIHHRKIGNTLATFSTATGATLLFAMLPYCLPETTRKKGPASYNEQFELPSIPLTTVSGGTDTVSPVTTTPPRNLNFISEQGIKKLEQDIKLSPEAEKIQEKFLNTSPISDFHTDALTTLNLPIGNKDFRDDADQFTKAIAFKLSQEESFSRLSEKELLNLAENIYQKFKKIRSLYTAINYKPPGPVTPVVLIHPVTQKTYTLRLNDVLIYQQEPNKMKNDFKFSQNTYSLSLQNAKTISETGSGTLLEEEVKKATE
jgi:hypothetical protein